MTDAFPSTDFAPATPTRAAWRRHLAVLAAVAAIIVATFWRDVTTLAHLWWTSTTFGHCLFIGPVLAWLVWARRADLAKLTPVGWAPGLVIVACGGLGWLLGDAGGVALARQLGLVMMLQGAVVTLLGPNVARGLLFPLCYAVFLVPFGEGMEGPLQTVTVSLTMPMLHMFGVPAQVDGVLITIPNGYFEVAEACSGAKFVIAMIAYGTLVANVCFVSWGRRAAFMVMALIVPVIANGLRAFGTIYVAYWTSVEQATGLDHIIYGWVFFGLVMVAVLAIGWKWFDRDPDAAWFDPATLTRNWGRHLDAPVAALLVLTVAASFIGWSSLVAARAVASAANVELPQVVGWERGPLSATAPWAPNFPNADHMLMGRYVDGQGRAVDLAVAIYDSQHEGKELVGFGIGAIRENDRWVRIEGLPRADGGQALRMVGPARVERETVTWYRIGGMLTGSDNRVKLMTLKNKMLGGNQAAAAVLVSAEQDADGRAHDAIEDFLRALGPVDRVADRMTGTR